jgi:hypothetical protein
MWPFLASLIAICAFAAILNKDRMLGTALILLANWGINTAMVSLSGDPAPWMGFLAVDYVSGFVLMVIAERPSRWQVAITALFALECIAHGAFGYSTRNGWTVYYYYWTLAYTSWAQVALVGAWGIVDLARRSNVPWRRSAPRLSGMDRTRSNGQEP